MPYDRLVKSLLATLVLAMLVVGAWLGREVSLSEQWPIFDGLRTTASFVFTVVGIWLALIYPEVRQTLSTWRQGFSRQAPRVSSLFEPLVDSALIVGVVSLIALLRPLLSRLPVNPEHLPVIRGASFAVLVALTVIQMRALYAAVTPLFGVGNEVNAQEERARVRSRFPEPRSSGSQRKPAEASSV
jgi:hypothetical protein